jgi:RES domain-containing protein
MRLGRVQPHPRYAELRDQFRAHPEWFGPWSATVFRFQTVDFPAPEAVLSGWAARVRGGRWNPPGLRTLYGSTTDTTALEECKASDRHYGVVTKAPRLLVAIEVQLERVLDLTRPEIRRSLGVTLAELAAEDWRKLSEAGQESFTQALGRAVAASGGSGLLARSAAVPRGVNLVIYPAVRAGDKLDVVEGEKLKRLGVRTRA